MVPDRVRLTQLGLGQPTHTPHCLPIQVRRHLLPQVVAIRILQCRLRQDRDLSMRLRQAALSLHHPRTQLHHNLIHPAAAIRSLQCYLVLD